MSNAETSAAEVVVTGAGEPRTVELNPAGTVIGRAAACDIVLDSPRVSRRHARLFRDPFGRWVIEDLGSRNGTWIGSARIDSRAVAPGETVSVGPFVLALAGAGAQRAVAADATVADVRASLHHSATGELATAQRDAREALSSHRLKQLNHVMDRLAALPSPDQLYPTACRAIADHSNAVAAALLIEKGDQPLACAPQVLACYARRADAHEEHAVMADIHLSCRVLESVRSNGTAVMASNVRLHDAQLELTLCNTPKSSAVFCAPVSETTDQIEVLYLDTPAENAPRDALDFVRAVARQVAFARKSLVFAEAKAERVSLDRQLSLAREIQLGFTPAGLDEFTDVDLAVLYQPAMWVGGDYYDVWRLADGRIAFAVGDVAGKGLPAAMVMTSLHTALRMTLNQQPHPGAAMDLVGSHLYRHLPGGLFVTMVLGVFDPTGGRLEFVNAGHILPIVVSPTGARDLGNVRNAPVGVIDEPFVTQEAELAAGESMVIVTDGITEAMTPTDEEFGRERLVKILSETGPQSASELTAAVASAAERFRHPRGQQDDITVFALHTRGEYGT